MAAWLAGAIAVSSAVGAGITAWSAGEAEDAQRAENRRAEALNLQLHGEALRESKRQFNENLKIEKKRFKFDKSQTQIQNVTNFANRFASAMNDNPRVANSFYQIAVQKAGQRRAA